MINKEDVERFLINKYGNDILKYKGFRYVRDIISTNEDYIIGSTMKEYKKIANEVNETYKSVERAVRHLKDMLGFDGNNTVFINNLIFEFKEWIKNND